MPIYAAYAPAQALQVPRSEPCKFAVLKLLSMGLLNRNAQGHEVRGFVVLHGRKVSSARLRVLTAAQAAFRKPQTGADPSTPTSPALIAFASSPWNSFVSLRTCWFIAWMSLGA